MADWKRLSKKLALADGRIDTKETRIIKDALLGDGVLDRSEFEFLMDLKKSATSVVGEFDDLVYESLKGVILKDHHVSAEEAAYLQKLIFADGSVDAREKKFLAEVKGSGAKLDPAFLALCAKAGV